MLCKDHSHQASPSFHACLSQPKSAELLDRINNGLVVPAEVTIELLQTSLFSALASSAPGRPAAAKIVLLDGFPRDMANLEAFQEAGWSFGVGIANQIIGRWLS